MTTKLTAVTVDEIALVSKGANRKKIFLRKEAGTVMENELNDAKVALEKAATDQAALVAKVEALEKASADAALAASEAVAAALAEKAVLEKAAADSEAAKVVLEKALADAAEAKSVAECIQKASVDYKNLPEKAEDLGPMLRSIRKSDAAIADRLESLLTKLDALAKGALDSKGTTQAVTKSDTALEEIEKRAAVLIAKGEAKSKADAFEKVLLSDKALYEQHSRESR